MQNSECSLNCIVFQLHSAYHVQKSDSKGNKGQVLASTKMSGHWGHKGSWALCFQKLEKNKTTSSVGIIKSEFLKWLKEMSSYRKHCSHKEKLEEHQSADRGASTCST